MTQQPPPLLQSLRPPSSFSVGLSTLETASRGVACLLRLAYCTYVLRVHPCGCDGLSFLLRTAWPPVCVSRCACLSSISRHLCCLHLLASVSSPLLSTCLQMSFQDPAFTFEGDMHSEVGLLGRIKPRFNVLRSRHSVFHSSGTTSIFHRQCPRIPTSWHPCRHLLCSLLVFVSFCFD